MLAATIAALDEAPVTDNQTIPISAEAPVDRHEMLRRITAAAVADPRIVALRDFGSSAEGRDDEWSDVDVEVFVRDEDFAAFERAWVEWAGGFGRLLLSFVGDMDNHWTVYDGVPVPLRVDFSLHRASEIPMTAKWPNAPVSVERMVLVDKIGELAAVVAPMVKQNLGPPDVPEHFERRCGTFWYYVVRTWCKLQRGPTWGVRYDLTYILHGILMDLLRLEAGALHRWRASHAADNLECDISPERLERLDRCIPGRESAQIGRALHEIALLGREVSTAAAARYSRAWPSELGDRMVALTKLTLTPAPDERTAR